MNTAKISESQSLKIMDEFLTIQDEPKIGIFWYDIRDDKLFGVNSVIAKDYPHLTISTLHKFVWAKEYNKRKALNKPLAEWSGDYKDTPRGRVFKSGDGFEVKVGSWINKYPQAKQLIIDEFDLQNSVVNFVIESHWELGQGYEF